MAKVTITFEDDEQADLPLVVNAEFEPEFKGDEGAVPTPAQQAAIEVLTLLTAAAAVSGGKEVLNEGTEFEERREFEGGQVARWA